MVKQVQIILDDHEYEALKKKKGDRTWKQFLIEASEKEASV